MTELQTLQNRFRTISGIMGRISVDLGRPYEDLGLNDYDNYLDWKKALKEELAAYESMRVDVLDEMSKVRGI